MSSPLQLGIVYRLDLTDKIQFGPVKKQTLYERFADGRIPGLLAEDLADSLYNNIEKPPSKNNNYNLVDDSDRKYKCHTITTGGTSLLPADQVGKGREYDKAKHIERMESLDAYIFIDVRYSPVFRIVAVPMEKLRWQKRLSALRFDKLIQTLKEETILLSKTGENSHDQTR